MPEVHGYFRYQNVKGPISVSYTGSHGTTPGCGQFRCQSQRVLPPPVGTLAITDTRSTVLLRDCRITRTTMEWNGSGIEMVCDFQDERWKWAGGSIDGVYNQLSPHMKLILYTVRSPTELALLLLAQMGVPKNKCTIDLPPGISSGDVKKFLDTLSGNGPNQRGRDGRRANPPQGAGAAQEPFKPIELDKDGFLPVGINLPATGTNPPVCWQAANPASELARMCDDYGRHIVYDYVSGFVHIVRPGYGNTLPQGGRLSIHGASVSLIPPAIPDAIKVTGSPTKYQGLLDVRAVGEEWDGSFVPIDMLSYAPFVRRDSTKYNLKTEPRNNYVYSVVISLPDDGPDLEFTYFSDLDATAAEIYEGIYNRIMASANPRITDNISASWQMDNGIEIFSKKPGFIFSVAGNFDIQTLSHGGNGERGWRFSEYPLFANVVATARLTRYQAMALAQKTVFKYYQFTGMDVYTPKDGERGKTIVPGSARPYIQTTITPNPQAAPAAPASGTIASRIENAEANFAAGNFQFQPPKKVDPPKVEREARLGSGRIIRRQQLVLLDTQVEQIVPELPNLKFIDKITTEAFILNYYNGRSHDKPNAAFGSICKRCFANAGIHYPQGDDNTEDGDYIPIDFTVDPDYQIFKFNSAVFRYIVGEGFLEPNIKIMAGYYLRHPVTNHLICYEDMVVYNPNGSNIQVVHAQDVQLFIYGEYDMETGQLKKANILERDAIQRARYYRTSAQIQYQVKAGQMAEYNSIEPIPLDGAICQVTLMAGPDGCSTSASLNMEHDVWIPRYPQRRRAENLANTKRILDSVAPSMVSTSTPNDGVK